MKKVLSFLTIIFNYQNAMMNAPNYHQYNQPYLQREDYLSPEGRLRHSRVDENIYNRQAQIHNQMYTLGIREGIMSVITIGSIYMLSTCSFILSICGIIASVYANKNYDKLLIVFQEKEHWILGTHTGLGKAIIFLSSFCLFLSIAVILIETRIVYYMLYQNNHNAN